MHRSKMKLAIAVVLLGCLAAVFAQPGTGGVDVTKLQLPDIDALGERTEVMTYHTHSAKTCFPGHCTN